MRGILATLISCVFFLNPFSWAQNCCVPAVPQHSVLGETVAMPHTLEIGLHYQFLCSGDMYEGSNTVNDPENTEAVWKRVSLTMAYGISMGISVSAIIPYSWKNKTKSIATTGVSIENSSAGIGDATFLVRFSPLARSFVKFRELSLGLGVKLPTGSTDLRNFGFLLPEELQPGTGSWDYIGTISYYQGLDLMDIIISGSYLMTTSHDNFKFGNQFSYLLLSNIHPEDIVEFSLALSGVIQGKDRREDLRDDFTGKRNIWLTPGLTIHAISEVLRLQVFAGYPVYQHFNGRQLGSEYNIHLTAEITVPFKN